MTAGLPDYGDVVAQVRTDHRSRFERDAVLSFMDQQGRPPNDTEYRDVLDGYEQPSDQKLAALAARWLDASAEWLGIEVTHAEEAVVAAEAKLVKQQANHAQWEAETKAVVLDAVERVRGLRAQHEHAVQLIRGMQRPADQQQAKGPQSATGGAGKTNAHIAEGDL